MINHEPSAVRFDGWRADTNFPFFPTIFGSNDFKIIKVGYIFAPELLGIDDCIKIVEVSNLNLRIKSVQHCNLSIHSLGEEDAVLVISVRPNQPVLLKMRKIFR